MPAAGAGNSGRQSGRPGAQPNEGWSSPIPNANVKPGVGSGFARIPSLPGCRFSSVCPKPSERPDSLDRCLGRFFSRLFRFLVETLQCITLLRTKSHFWIFVAWLAGWETFLAFLNASPSLSI